MPQLLSTLVAARYLQKQAAGFFTEVDQIYTLLAQAQTQTDTLRGYFQLVEDLLEAGERRRLGRVSDINVGPVQFDGQKVEANVAGTTGSYEVRITVAPKRGHRCTCPDWQQNGSKVGPCKHVLALGLAWKNQSLQAAANKMESSLEAILQRQI